MAINSIDNAKDESVATHTEDYYEEQTSQEQLYLDEVEENLRVILTSEHDYPANDVNDCSHGAERYEEQSTHGASGSDSNDSDHPPLGDEMSMKMWLGSFD